MGLFGKKKEPQPKPIATTPQSTFMKESNYVDRKAVSKEVQDYPRDLVGSIEQVLQMVPLAKAAIPQFSTFGRSGNIDLGKVVQNTGKSQPYVDKVQVLTEADVYHFWYYPSGKIWKAECYFWPDNAPGFVLKVRRPDNDENAALEIEELGVKVQINRKATVSI